MKEKNRKELLKELRNLYASGKYGIGRDLDLHASWKVTRIIPLIDRLFLEYDDILERGEIDILDVGGGTGLILAGISEFINKNYRINVNKFALDLDPNLLEVQKKRNPELKKALNEDICKTSLADKEIDLTLMVDVLEHIPDVKKCLRELQRISKFVIFKVPLQDNLTARILNLITIGKYRQSSIEGSGHINFYNFKKLKNQIERSTGRIIDYYFANVFDYFLKSEYYRKNMNIAWKIYCYMGSIVFKLAPKLCSCMFTDYAMILVKCY